MEITLSPLLRIACSVSGTAFGAVAANWVWREVACFPATAVEPAVSAARQTPAKAAMHTRALKGLVFGCFPGDPATCLAWRPGLGATISNFRFRSRRCEDVRSEEFRGLFGLAGLQIEAQEDRSRRRNVAVGSVVSPVRNGHAEAFIFVPDAEFVIQHPRVLQIAP